MAEQTEEKKGNSKAIIIGIIATLLGISGLEGYFILNKTNTIKAKNDTLTVVRNENTDLIQKIDSVQKSLQEQISRGDLLQTEKDSLIKLNEQLEADKKSLKKQVAAIPAIRAKYEARLAEAETMMNDMKQKVENTDSTMKAMYNDLMALKNEKAHLLDSITKVTAEKDELSKTVKIAQVLKADNFHITVLKKNGKEKDDEKMVYKAKAIDKVKVNFNVLENKVAVVETKTFYLKVMGPDGAVIFNESTGGGSVEEDGENTNYTSKQDMLYDGKKQVITFLYHNQSGWKKGVQKIEVVCEGKKIGSGSFEVK